MKEEAPGIREEALGAEEPGTEAVEIEEAIASSLGSATPIIHTGTATPRRGITTQGTTTKDMSLATTAISPRTRCRSQLNRPRPRMLRA